MGLTTPPHKKQFVTETGNVDHDTTLAGGVTAGAAMMLLGQSQREAQRPMGPMVAPKRRTTISCWNALGHVMECVGSCVGMTAFPLGDDTVCSEELRNVFA